MAVRSYSRMIGHTSLEQNTGIFGAHWPISRCGLALVRRIAIGMQQRQHDPFGAERHRLVERLAQARLVERPVDGAVGQHPFAHRQHAVARDQRLGA